MFLKGLDLQSDMPSMECVSEQFWGLGRSAAESGVVGTKFRLLERKVKHRHVTLFMTRSLYFVTFLTNSSISSAKGMNGICRGVISSSLTMTEGVYVDYGTLLDYVHRINMSR